MRRRLFTVGSLALTIALAASPLVAEHHEMEPDQLLEVRMWKVADVAGFEEGVKAHNAFHASIHDTGTHITGQMITGNQVGTFVRVRPGITWADLDADPEAAKADAMDVAKTLVPYIEPTSVKIFRVLPKISNPAENWSMQKVVTFEVTSLGARQFQQALEKFHEALQSIEDPPHYQWYELVDGGTGPTFVATLPGNSWADFAPKMDFGAVMAEHFGDEADEIFRSFLEPITKETWETVLTRFDLSYIPEEAAE